MANLKLRPYQKECLQSIQEHYARGVNRQLIHLPTAAGKTVIFSHLIRLKNCRSLVLAHTLELLSQAKEKINMISPGLGVGIVDADNKGFTSQVVVCSLQSARQQGNLKQLQQQNFDLLVYDESAHSSSDSARIVLKELGFGSGTQKLLTGFTATPMRTDGRGLGEDFDAIVYTRSVKWMIEQGYLCPPVGIKIATNLDLSKVTVDNGDFVASSLSKVMNTDQLNALVVDTYMEKALGRKAICFSTSIEHAQNLSELFKARGLSSEFVSGGTPSKERKNILDRFKDGHIDVLCNCQVLTEGFDAPVTDCIILARPTQSPGLYQQMAGRGLRRHPNKTDCIILDFGDRNHSLCGIAMLIGDAECMSKRCQENTTMLSLAKSLPPKINQKLKKAILTFNPLGDDFFWQKDGSGYFLKGSGNKILHIVRTVTEDKYDAILLDEHKSQYIAQDLSFEFAFCAAEDFAKNNRSLFAISDFDAPWRTLPISDKQKSFFRSNGYRAGIEDLSRGQAALIISSGVLNKKTLRR